MFGVNRQRGRIVLGTFEHRTVRDRVDITSIMGVVGGDACPSIGLAIQDEYGVIGDA